jgi:hypothetical protein
MKQAAPSSIDQGGGKRRGEGIGLRVRLWIRAPNLHAFGDEGILWRPSVHRVAIGALGKCNSVGQLIDVCQINIDARGDKPFCSWALEHQFCQRSLHQSPAKNGEAYAIRDKRSAAATVNALQFEIHVVQTTVLPRFARQPLIHCLVSKFWRCTRHQSKTGRQPRIRC